MGKFRDSGAKEIPAISTASLPDIIFMLLFFFMISTSMKEVDYQVQIRFPEATELQSLEKKELIRFVYVGNPTMKYRAQYGTEARVQLDDAIINDLDQIKTYIENQRASMAEEKQPHMVVALKVDRECKMGIVTDIKQRLRQVSALKINYVSSQRANSQL